jgi:hypothetical protein
MLVPNVVPLKRREYQKIELLRVVDCCQIGECDMTDGATQGKFDQAGVRLNPDRAIQDDVIHARLAYQNDPKEYQSYILNLRNGFASGSASDEAILGKIELYDAKTSDVRTAAEIQALTGNDDELYKLLDNYHDSNHGGSWYNPTALFAPGPDGNIGANDVADFLDDAHKPGNPAYDYVQKNPQVLDIVRGMPTGGFTISNLLDQQGFSGDNTQQQFRSYYGDNLPKSQTQVGK